MPRVQKDKMPEDPRTARILHQHDTDISCLSTDAGTLGSSTSTDLTAQIEEYQVHAFLNVNTNQVVQMLWAYSIQLNVANISCNRTDDFIRNAYQSGKS
jgi:hypothetical protein